MCIEQHSTRMDESLEKAFNINTCSTSLSDFLPEMKQCSEFSHHRLCQQCTCLLMLAGVNWLRIGCNPVASAAVL